MKILQINVTVNIGSTGRISEQIGELILNEGYQSYIAYSRPGSPSRSKTIKIGNKLDFYKHVLITRLFDKHGFASKRATQHLIQEIDNIKPDVIHLHNIHGYYIHIEVLFNYLKKNNIPIVWTLHDCWSFTGHCAHFEDINCEKWKTGCYSCPKVKSYPKSWFIDSSKINYKNKQEIFKSFKNLIIVTPSYWLKNLVGQSFFKNYKVKVIQNGIDLSVFKPKANGNLIQTYDLNEGKIILGVASIWAVHRGLADFIELSKILHADFKIVLVGLSKKQMKEVPENITGIERTENINELVTLYSTACIYINPTYSDNFPTTNIEALACGTPVITYNTGGSPEAINEHTGIVVERGNINGIKDAIDRIINSKNNYTQELCRERAINNFDKNDRYKDYLDLYYELNEN